MKIKIALLIAAFSCVVSSQNAFSQAKKDTTLSRPPSSSSSSNSSDGVLNREGVVQAPAGTPTRAIQDLETKMDSYKTGENLSAEDKAKNAQIKKEVIGGTFDIRELSRLSLDKHWGTISAAEQNNFVSLMTQLLEKKAILSKEQSKTKGKKYSIKYLGDTFLDAQKTKSKTKTSIFVPKESVNVSIDYKLVKTAKDWKIFDVIVDDASLVENYKYQFNSIITKYGYSELVKRMSKKLGDLG